MSGEDAPVWSDQNPVQIVAGRVRVLRAYRNRRLVDVLLWHRKLHWRRILRASMSDPAVPAESRPAQAPGVSAGDHLRQLSPLLVWAVVFADIGTSVYYVPGILYQQVREFAPLL